MSPDSTTQKRANKVKVGLRRLFIPVGSWEFAPTFKEIPGCSLASDGTH
jgi:hypothetical protein